VSPKYRTIRGVVVVEASGPFPVHVIDFPLDDRLLRIRKIISQWGSKPHSEAQFNESVEEFFPCTAQEKDKQKER
jgi:hypothetical protein